MNKFITKLKEMEACGEAIDWIKEKGIDSVEEFWKVSDRGDWMLWLIDNDYPGVNIDIKILQDLALEFAIMSVPYAKKYKQLCIDCIYAKYQYLDGWIDFDVLKKYRNAVNAVYYVDSATYAVYATYAAVNAAAFTVTYAAYSAAYDASAAAYSADAVAYADVSDIKQKMYKLQADLIRQYVPTLEIE